MIENPLDLLADDCPHLCEAAAGVVANALNESAGGPQSSRFYKVVNDTFEKPYKLQPGFEP